jgi:hypothetical protein
MRRRKFSSSLIRQSMSRTTVAAANHNDRNQVTAVPPRPLSIRLIAVLNGARLLETRLSDHRRCRCATLVPPPPLVCRPLCFADSLSLRLLLLSQYCAPLVQLIVVLPGGLPPPLSRRLRLSSRLPIRWLSRRVASRCLVPSPSPPLSSRLRLSLRPSRSVGGRVVSIRLIAVLSGARLLETRLSDHRRCRCATLVPPPPLVCRPLCFADSLSRRLHLLSQYCAPLVQLIVVVPGGLHLSAGASASLHASPFVGWRVALRHVVWCLGLPPPLSSRLRLSLHPSRSVGGRVVLPGAQASLSARRVGVSSRSRLSSSRRAPLLTQRF